MNPRFFSRQLPVAVLAFFQTGFVSAGNTTVNSKPAPVPCRIKFESGFQEESDLKRDQALWSKGLKKKKVKEVLAGIGSSAYPKGLSTAEERNANIGNIKKMVTYLVAKYVSSESNILLLEIPAAENLHMPAELRPAKNIYIALYDFSVAQNEKYSPARDGATGPYYDPAGFYPGKLLDCRIMKPEAIQLDYDVTQNQEWRQYVDSTMAQEIVDYCHAYDLPYTLQTQEDLVRFRDFLPYFSCQAVAVFHDNGVTRYILRINIDDNYLMPTDLLPDYEVYLVVDKDGLDLTRGYSLELDGSPEDLTWPEEETITDTPDEENTTVTLPENGPIPCRITDAGELYSTYNLSTYRNGLVVAFGEETADYMIANSTESAWPAGLSTLDLRTVHNPEFKYFVLTEVASLNNGNMLILLVSAAKNKHMPAGLRPEKDFYFVYNKPGVSTDRGYDPLQDGKP